MEIIPLGLVTPGASPGTPVALTANASIACAKLIVAQVAGQTGTVYFGKANLQRSGGSPAFQGVVRQFQAPAASGGLDYLTIEAFDGNPLHPYQFYVDADTANQGLLVSYVQE